MPEQGDIERADWPAWLALRRVPGVGNVVYRELLTHFPSPREALRASVRDLRAAGVAEGVAEQIAGFADWAAVEGELAALTKLGARLVTRTDPEYPERLAQIHDPPPFLYVQGHFAPEDRLAIAIVGARSASRYGRRGAQLGPRSGRVRPERGERLGARRRCAGPRGRVGGRRAHDCRIGVGS